jgi:hypothetical protein
MRVTQATLMGPRGALICAVVALAVSVGAVGTVTAGGGPTAVASKKKCKKARWKCAPKIYHLSASGTFASSRGSEVWSAEVDLGKRRASVGTVDYAQDGGKVTVSGSGSKSFDDDCTSSSGEPTYNVPQQTLNVPRGGINDADFGVSFHLRFKGVGKNEYGLGVGAVQPELSNIKGTATVTCPEGTTHTEEFFYVNTIPLTVAIVRPGKVGSPVLTGSAQDNARSSDESVTWKLTAKK